MQKITKQAQGHAHWNMEMTSLYVMQITGTKDLEKANLRSQLNFLCCHLIGMDLKCICIVSHISTYK